MKEMFFEHKFQFRIFINNNKISRLLSIPVYLQKASYREIKNDLQKALNLAKIGRAFHFGSNTGNVHGAPPVREQSWTPERSQLSAQVWSFRYCGSGSKVTPMLQADPPEGHGQGEAKINATS